VAEFFHSPSPILETAHVAALSRVQPLNSALVMKQVVSDSPASTHPASGLNNVGPPR
jgi:hypothetical protein